MTIDEHFIHNINDKNFERIALQTFIRQYNDNDIYKSYVDALKIKTESVATIEKIPFLPISFFKTHEVICGNNTDSLYFESSGTATTETSKHFVPDAAIYEDSLLKGFEEFYGSPKDYAILALLPSYLERKNASLVYMADLLMKNSEHEANGFFLNEWEKLAGVLEKLEAEKQKTILLGVTFALLDFAEKYPMNLSNTIVMETGGMKGRKEEITRTEVHSFLKQQWNLKNVHSEYGMTELLSQAYAKNDGIFYASSTMKVFVRDINDPFDIKNSGVGCLNIVDLANIHSCSFIATDDIGKLNDDASFEVLGRMDYAALRGCSLMTA